MKIKIYTNPHCPHSNKLMKFLKRRKLKFEELTLFKEATTRVDLINKTGMMSTPTIQIDEELLVGFNEGILKKIIKDKKKEIKRR